MKRWTRYLSVFLACVVTSALLLEGMLQVGALMVSGHSRHVEARWLTGHSRILALGDSNTYGLYLEATDSWPMQLEQLWNSTHAKQGVELLNLGYPGTNSFRVRDNMPALLEKLSPDLVLIMVGFNDFWTPLEQVQPDVKQTPLDWLASNSRILRGIVMWQRERIVQKDLAFGSPRPSENVDLEKFKDPANIDKHLLRMDGESFYLGTRQGEPAKNMKSLADNLSAMIAMTRARGTEVILMTYPSNGGFYPSASKWIRKAGEQNGVDVIDIALVFSELCPKGPKTCPDYFFPDGHATAKGNALVAEKVSEFFSHHALIQ